MGHSAARCKNPRKCGICWGDGHIGSFCKQNKLSPTAKPFTPTISNPTSKTTFRGEPAFKELLQNPINRGMPENRPKKIACFVERDEEYFEERAKLEKAVVMYNSELEIDLTIEQIAAYAATSGVVKADEVQVGIMNRSRSIIILPDHIDPAAFIGAIPWEVWNKGFSFSLWSPLTDTTLSIPHFKVLIDLIGIPLDIYREKEVVRAVSSFGTFLGTVEQPMEGDLACWTVALATTDLALIPHQVGFIVGGIETPVDVFTKTWMHCDVYKPEEMAQPRKQFFPPPPPVVNDFNSEDDDHFIGSRKVLEMLCSGIEFDKLPVGVQKVLRGGKSMTDRPENFT